MDKKEALEIVKSSGYELENLSDEFKKDKEIVLEAVKQDGYALGCALGDLRQHPLLKSIAEETKRRNKQYISYKLFSNSFFVIGLPSSIIISLGAIANTLQAIVSYSSKGTSISSILLSSKY